MWKLDFIKYKKHRVWYLLHTFYRLKSKAQQILNMSFVYIQNISEIWSPPFLHFKLFVRREFWKSFTCRPKQLQTSYYPAGYACILYYNREMILFQQGESGSEFFPRNIFLIFGTWFLNFVCCIVRNSGL